MKLLAIFSYEHDTNISYYDGMTVKYFKSERMYQIKHHAYSGVLDWKKDIKQLWNITTDDVDDMIFIHHRIDWDPNAPLEIFQNKNINNLELSSVCANTEWFAPNHKLQVVNHHYCHTLSSWMLDKDPDVSIVIDSVGDWYTWSVYRNHNCIDRMHHDIGSIGKAIDQASQFLGIEASNYLDLAGKLMGLQSYGNIDQNFLNFIRKLSITDINSLYNPDHWFDYKKSKLLARHSLLDWIATVHYRTGEILIELFKKYVKPNEIVHYSGGVAQNVIWNTELRKHFPNLIIAPHCADDGQSLGALEWLRIKHDLPKFKIDNFPYIQSDEAPITTPSTETIKQVAKFLAEGSIVGWYQSNGEIGPRALGNRSILMDPRIPDGKDKINKIKKREQYRPFGASVLKEYANGYFEDANDDFMLYTTRVKVANLQAITHVDGTCRVQTVTDNAYIFKNLLTEFYNITGCPVLLNTSMNINGKPIVGYIDNAKEFFYTSKLDVLVIGDEIFTK
jgi:carbamoyltransferase